MDRLCQSKPKGPKPSLEKKITKFLKSQYLFYQVRYGKTSIDFLKKRATQISSKSIRCLFCAKLEYLVWFYIPVNSYGHVETVSSPNHIKTGI